MLHSSVTFVRFDTYLLIQLLITLHCNKNYYVKFPLLINYTSNCLCMSCAIFGRQQHFFAIFYDNIDIVALISTDTNSIRINYIQIVACAHLLLLACLCVNCELNNAPKFKYTSFSQLMLQYFCS